MPTCTGTFAAVAATLVWAVSAFAAPPQSQYAVSHPSHPTPPRVAIDRGMSLEHECLNVLRATRSATRLPAPAADDPGKRDAATLHLHRAETAARAGRGQLCQDELALAAESLR